MGASTEERTGVFDMKELLGGKSCPDCEGLGQLRFDSENINEHFEVEKQTVITPCPRCSGNGFLKGS